MKDKYRIFLIYIFKVIMEINLPKFASVSILSIFGVFNIFLPNVARLLYGFFKELKPVAV